MYAPDIPLRKRTLGAVRSVALNVVFWIVVPYYVGVYLSSVVPQSAITIPTFVYAFGAAFTALDAGAAFFRGRGMAVPCISGVALLSAAYIWLVANGGSLAVNASGVSVALGFRLLLYLVVLPSVGAAVRAPLSYLFWRRAVRREAPGVSVG